MSINQFKEISGISDLACNYKWAWSTIYLQRGHTSSCHRTRSDPIDLDDFDNFHNTPSKLETRQMMLEGEWPGQGCEYCKNIEEAGGISDRTEINSRSSTRIIPIETLKDNRSVRVTPTMVEIYFSNLCNMSCIYCGPGWSSTWEAEVSKYPSQILPFLNNQLFEQQKMKSLMPVLIEKFFSWLERNCQSLVDLNVLGGEPFFQPETERLLDFFDRNACPDLTLKIFSNLKVQKLKFNRILDRLENLVDTGNIREACITTSLDCWGSQQEYIRWGIDLKQWQDNFSDLSSRNKIFLEVHGTMTSLTIETIPDLIDQINYYSIRDRRHIAFTNNFVFNPACLAPGIFPKGFFDRTFDVIISKIQNDNERQIMLGYQNSINNSQYRPDLIIQLKNYLNELDSKRNTNWRKTFSWLEDFKC
jgi:organic radical activating enzyme